MVTQLKSSNLNNAVKADIPIYPKTTADAVMIDDSTTLSDAIEEIQNQPTPAPVVTPVTYMHQYLFCFLNRGENYANSITNPVDANFTEGAETTKIYLHRVFYNGDGEYERMEITPVDEIESVGVWILSLPLIVVPCYLYLLQDGSNIDDPTFIQSIFQRNSLNQKTVFYPTSGPKPINYEKELYGEIIYQQQGMLDVEIHVSTETWKGTVAHI